MREHFSHEPLTLTLPLQIADRLAHGIVEEHFLPGERLKEMDLAANFGVSRATIRESLRILEKRRLVSIVPQHGAQVAKLSRQELEHMFDVRIVLQGLASSTLARRVTPDIDSKLQEGMEELLAARDDGNLYARASARMSLLIAVLAQNELLLEQLTSFAQHIGRYARLGFMTANRREQSLRNWMRLLKAISAGDADAAEALHRLLSQESKAAAMAELDRRTAQ